MIRIGTRASNLAMWQAEYVRDRLLETNAGLDVELVPITTKGDRILDRPLSQVGGKGLFVKEVEAALLDGRADIAVHSLKDMPVEQPAGLELVAFPERGTPFDVLCHAEAGMTLDTLPVGARIGTSSLRRAALLLHLRPDLEIVSVRGSVETRLSKRFEEDLDLDAVVLAEAGLRRLEIWEDDRFEVLGPPRFIPAPAQGVLAIEIREGDEESREAIAGIDHEPTRLALLAERSCLAGIEGNCHTPFGAYARIEGDTIYLVARLLEDDGRATSGDRSMSLPDGEDARDSVRDLGAALANELLTRHHQAYDDA